MDRLKQFKRFERESYDEVLNTLLDEQEEEELSDEEIKEIQAGLEDIKMGRVTPIEEVAKKLGVSLK